MPWIQNVALSDIKKGNHINPGENAMLIQIVAECIISAEQEWIRNGDTEHNRAISKVIGSIKKHFGVN